MKTADFYWDHPQLKRFERTVKAGDYLFRQNSKGNTMVILMRGLIELVAERDKKEYVISLVQAGDFLGEKAIVKDTPYPRAYSAKVKVDSVILEMSLKAIEAVRKAAPEIMNDIFKHIFQIAAERLDRANSLTRGLRSSDNIERLLHIILYAAATSGRRSAQGYEFILKPETVFYYIDMIPEKVESCLHEFGLKKLLIPQGGDCYLLPSAKNLIHSMPTMKTQLGLGFYDELEIAP